MFSYFFDTPAEPDEKPRTTATKPSPSSTSQDPEDKYKIDPGYYFKHLDPNQIKNVVTNFNQEVETG
jgi:hypothetical protein